MPLIASKIPRSNIPGMNTKLLGRRAPMIKASHTIDKATVEKTAVVHAPIDHSGTQPVELQEKDASWQGVKDSLKELKTPLLSAVAVSTVPYAIGGVHDFIQGKLDDREAEKTFNAAVASSPTLQRHMSENPSKTRAYYDLLTWQAPVFKKSPLLAATRMEELVNSDGVMNAEAFKDALDIQNKVYDISAKQHTMRDAMAAKGYETGVKSVINTALKKDNTI